MDINFAFMLLGQILPCLTPQKMQESFSDVSQCQSWLDVRASASSSVSNAFKQMKDFDLVKTTVFRRVCFTKHLPVHVLGGTWLPKSMP